MIFNRIIFILFFFLISISFCEVKEVDKLMEKVNQTKDKEEKKILIEKLKQKLAKKNLKAKQEADAIIEAKQKIPSRIFDDKALEK